MHVNNKLSKYTLKCLKLFRNWSPKPPSQSLPMDLYLIHSTDNQTDKTA